MHFQAHKSDQCWKTMRQLVKTTIHHVDHRGMGISCQLKASQCFNDFNLIATLH
uniref:Uncharacterized protein n=1 Tax=Rhizophora mucronata TaxID=61149 RepID=A0A2P2PAF4_RHIMU